MKCALIPSSVALGWLAIGCEPELVVGAWACPPLVQASDGGAVPALDKVVEVPWAAGFERDFCDYTRTGGFCFSSPGATHRTVDAPVHEGRGAAAFSVIGDPDSEAGQARCFREGTLPEDAVYGAWFYVPAAAENTGNWNLMHFQGGAPGDLHGLWDVSLGSADDGSLFLYVFDFLGPGMRLPTSNTDLSVPIGEWFQMEIRLRRSAGSTGIVELYQDGRLLLDLPNVTTDDTTFGQWYVGNLANALNPPASTLYIDDVTITAP